MFVPMTRGFIYAEVTSLLDWQKWNIDASRHNTT
jgi:hypothetical protein